MIGCMRPLSRACAGQVWGEFRKESYKRHRILGRVTLLSMALAMLTAARYALLHLAGDTAAEKVRLPCMLANIARQCCCRYTSTALSVRGLCCRAGLSGACMPHSGEESCMSS